MNLELIRGRVTNLVVTKGSTDPVFEKMNKGVAGIGAIAAAATGQLLSSTALANASQGAEIDVEYFSCVVNDLRLFGHFYRVEFKDGDEMEFVFERYLGRGSVQGARSPVDRLIWTLPYQTRGVVAQLRHYSKWRLIGSAGISVVFTGLFIFSRPSDLDLPIWVYGIIFILGTLNLLMVSFLVTRRFRKFALNATKVFEAFGYEDSASIDLPSLNREAERKWSQEKKSSPQGFQPWRFRY